MKKNGAVIFVKAAGIRHIRAAFYGWFFNLIASILVYWGFYKLFSSVAGKTVVAADIQGEIGLFNFLMDIIDNYPGTMGLVFSIGFMSLLLYFITSIFLAGGIYSVLVGEERATISNLLTSSVENFFKMVKMFLVNLINWVVALIFPILFSIILFNSPSIYQNETLLPVFIYTGAFITLFILTYSMAIYDFSRIFKLREDKGVFKSFFNGLKFTYANKGNVLVIFLFYGITLLIFYLLHTLLINIIGELIFPILLFCLYQLIMLFRYYLKITVMKAEVKLTQVPVEIQ